MRRTPRTEFTDARSAAVEARKAMLERVGLRQAEVEPEPQFARGGVIQASDADRVPGWLSEGCWFHAGTSEYEHIVLGQINNERIRRRTDPLIDIRATMERVQGWLREPQTGLMPDAYHGGQRATVRAMYDPVVWPDEGYPCQLCWAVGRWPWEPMRSCPITVDVESTYCEKHGGKAKQAPKAGNEPSFVAWDETTANLSAPNWNGLANVVVHHDAPPSHGLMQVIEPSWASSSRWFRDALDAAMPEFDRAIAEAAERAISTDA